MMAAGDYMGEVSEGFMRRSAKQGNLGPPVRGLKSTAMFAASLRRAGTETSRSEEVTVVAGFSPGATTHKAPRRGATPEYLGRIPELALIGLVRLYRYLISPAARLLF